MMVVLFCCLVILAKTSTTSIARLESRLAVGSSANIIEGLLYKARAIATRCFSPPEICSGNLFFNFSIPSSSNKSNGLFSFLDSLSTNFN